MSSVGTLGAGVAYSNALQGRMDLGATLTTIAHNADNAMAGMLDKLVQQGIDNSGSAPPGMGKVVDTKA
ncbi:hypothetical protein SAMN04515647_0987 [Cohaesibacter sp. ES.047]|uniref:hypothetical protein n=1 Tax=Cohaesibacter sp. ES.047 TaxID=1798205 RepID=UPI000BC07D24|nr:hypothetical protein [Cohaesibacter sp. ES.047]SNY90814.1 hypothetical protein SAMN04515647_0987 [Cohaesibacter sp. ES.047]